MLTTVKHQFKRKAEILVREGQHLISKSPVVVIAKNGSATKIDIKTASTCVTADKIESLLHASASQSGFHGQILRDSAGNVDLIAEMGRHPDALWIRVKAIEADSPNDNGDYFSREEVIKSYKTFEGVPVFTNHENNKVEAAKGKVVSAEWDEREGAVYCTMFIDRKANAALCRAIEEGYVTDVSMGTQVDFSTCSVCEKKALTAEDYCEHVKTLKGRSIEGRKVFEKNYGLKFIEISVVTDGACKDCTIREVLDPQEYLTRVAAAVLTMNRQVKVGQMTKDGGQAEIQKLNQAMDLLEDVSRTMLDQRQYIDLEFLNKVVEVLSDLQHVNDELVDQGYGRMGDPSQGQQSAMGVPPMPENSGAPMQEQATEGPKPFLSGPSGAGVGTVTEPATASSGGKILVSARIKDLHERVTKIYEEAKLSSGGVSVDKEKANQTIAKLATIWANPSVKKYEGEFREGEYKVVFSGDEIVAFRGGTKVAALNRNDLDSDLKQELRDNPRVCAGHLLDSLKTTFAGKIVEAGYAPTDTAAQQEETMEAQLRNQKPPLHPRTNEIRESITEDQLRDKREGYDYHERQEKTRDAITEKQLREGDYQGYDYHKVQDEPRDETFELQLRNTKWKGNVTPAGKEGEWSAGVSDQLQQITEGQLQDMAGKESKHLPTDRITEKQLVEDAENWGRRIASKDDAKKAVTAGFKALAKAALATGATPDEILEAIYDFTANPRNTLAAQRAVASLAAHKEMRQAMLNRSKFHGAAKISTAGEVADYILGSMSDEGMSGPVALETLEIISGQKTAYKQIADAIASAKADEVKPVKAASSKDFLREVLAENSRDEIRIFVQKSEIKADPKDVEKFAAAAYEVAEKTAAKSGIKITDKIHVAEKDGQIEVAFYGMKAEAGKGDFGGKKAPPFGSKKTDGEGEDEDKKPENKKPEDKKASTEELKARKEARKEIVAQFGGDMPGGAAGGAPGGQPGPGGGTTMPAAPAGADPTAGVPPVAGLGGDPAAGDEEGVGGEALPPGSICPVCGSEDMEMRHGEFTCNECGAAGDIHVKINVTEWPGVIEDTEPKNDEDGLGLGGEEAGGIGDMSGGAGMEMPGVGMQAAFRITPNMVRIAGNKPVGSFCPHCGSSKVKLALKKGAGKGECELCKGTYEVETLADIANKSLIAKIRWEDKHAQKFAKKICEQNKLAKKAAKEMQAKKASLDSALRKTGLVAKFAAADLNGKAEIIAELADKKLLSK